MGLGSSEALPAELEETTVRRGPLVAGPLIHAALELRPDVRAARLQQERADSALALARREALPDLSLAVSYTHSEFQVSGDNPNALGVSVSLPLPIFDRNQGNIGRARLDGERARNDSIRLELQVRHEVTDAVRRATRAATLVGVYEGGMLDRAETALKVAEKSYQAGAVSLLELLEAQRTYLETKGAYLRALHDYRQANVDVVHAVGGEAN